MQTVSAEWKNAFLENMLPESFVEVSYKISDYNAERDASASDNGHYPFSNTAQIVDMIEKSFEKYITLEQNQWILDGTFNVFSGDAVQNTGFVSSVLSNTDCTFTNNPVITISFTTTHTNPIPGITITWSSAFNEWASDFIVTVYNGSNVVNTLTVNNNTDITSLVEMNIENYNKIEVEIVKWSLPNHRARIEEIIVGLKLIFGKNRLLGFENIQEGDILSFNLPKAEVVFSIDNVDGKWNPDNPQGIYRYMLERQEVNVRFGYKIDNAIEWISCGSFFLSEWETPQNGIQATFTARDALEFMYNPFVPYAGTYTLKALATQAFVQADLPLTKDGTERWAIDDSLDSISITIPTNDDGSVSFKYTCAEVVQLCANAGMCIVYQDRDGYIHIEPISGTLTDYIINQFNSYKNAEYNISKELQGVNVNDGMANTSTGLKGEIQSVSNPLIQTNTVANNVAMWIQNMLLNRKELNGNYRSDPRLDVFDKVTVENKYATSTMIVTNIRYTYNGAFNGTYEGRVVV